MKRSKPQRIALVADRLVADFYALGQMIVNEPSRDERRKLFIELWGLATAEIPERAAQVDVDTRMEMTRQAPRKENRVRDRLIAKARDLYAKNPKLTINGLADEVLIERASSYPTQRTMRAWISEEQIVTQK